MSCTCHCCYGSRKWSQDEDICRKHNITMEFTGYIPWANQNGYKCHKCDYEHRTKQVLEKRAMGRHARLELYEKIKNGSSLNGMLKEMYSDDLKSLIPMGLKYINNLTKNKK